MIRISIFTLLLLSTPSFLPAQVAPKPRLSPLAMTTMRFEGAYIKITYGQPQKRGRNVFGELVPFGQVWRTGANEATEITVTRDIYINAILLKAGTYSVFTIPDKIKWTVIINKDVGLWGSYNYNPARDVFRFDVAVQDMNEVFESLTMVLDQNNDRADWNIMWDKIKVTIPIRFTIQH